MKEIIQFEAQTHTELDTVGDLYPPAISQHYTHSSSSCDPDFVFDPPFTRVI